MGRPDFSLVFANAHPLAPLLYSKMNSPPHYSSDADVEKRMDDDELTTYGRKNHQGVEVSTAPVDEEIVREKGPVFRALKKFFAMGVEARGIEVSLSLS